MRENAAWREQQSDVVSKVLRNLESIEPPWATGRSDVQDLGMR